MNLGGNRRWAPLRKSGTNHLILGIGISPTSPPGLFPTHFLREKPWGWGWYLANLRDRGKKWGGRGVRGYSSNPSTWFDKEKKTSGTQGIWWQFPLYCLNFNKFRNTTPLNLVINLDNFTYKMVTMNCLFCAMSLIFFDSYLWCGNDNGSIYTSITQVLNNRQMLIGCSRWRVHNKIVYITPVNIT